MREVELGAIFAGALLRYWLFLLPGDVRGVLAWRPLAASVDAGAGFEVQACPRLTHCFPHAAHVCKIQAARRDATLRGVALQVSCPFSIGRVRLMRPGVEV
jgi:hypothetical protein